jgi:hypothetical protein
MRTCGVYFFLDSFAFATRPSSNFAPTPRCNLAGHVLRMLLQIFFYMPSARDWPSTDPTSCAPVVNTSTHCKIFRYLHSLAESAFRSLPGSFTRIPSMLRLPVQFFLNPLFARSLFDSYAGLRRVHPEFTRSSVYFLSHLGRCLVNRGTIFSTLCPVYTA